MTEPPVRENGRTRTLVPFPAGEREPLAFSLDDASRCMVSVTAALTSRCRNAAVASGMIGCVNEFIRWNRYCAVHLARLTAGEPHWCLRCRMLGAEHGVQLLEVRMDADASQTLD